VAISLSRKCDYLLHRHINFDPFSVFFSLFIKNRITVHHSKEIEELKLIRPGVKGRVASIIESSMAKFALRRNLALLGVTSEIAKYQLEVRELNMLWNIYPNGVSYKSINLANDQREKKQINVAFICGTFSKWHGLDRLVDALNTELVNSLELKIHLIGNMSSVDKKTKDSVQFSEVYELHGFLKEEDYKNVIGKCDIGFGSFAMDREGLTEGATLKVRELLAMGFPVISGHSDVSLPHDFPYYYNVSAINLEEILDYARKMKSISRQGIRSESRKYIEKRVAMEKVIKWLDAGFFR
jgi:glycosyltransferase involved in cell wall biosynthesis